MHIKFHCDISTVAGTVPSVNFLTQINRYPNPPEEKSYNTHCVHMPVQTLFGEGIKILTFCFRQTPYQHKSDILFNHTDRRIKKNLTKQFLITQFQSEDKFILSPSNSNHFTFTT